MTSRPRYLTGDRRGSRPPQYDRTSAGTVVDRVKRVTAVVLGGTLLVRGLRRRSPRGLATALAGGWLVARAVGRDSRRERALGSRAATGGRGDGRTEAAGATAVSRSVTVGKPADELYEAWRDPEQFSRVMGHFAEVTAMDGDRLTWTVHGPQGRDVSWETRIVEEEPGELLRWETPDDATVPNEGAVRFRPAPGDRGTEVTLSLGFDPPGGGLGKATLERLDVVPSVVAGRALGRFKSLVESGEIPTLAGNPSARGRGDLL